ncbi:MAG: CvpA family protein [Desulfohalobiaceae bacterium]|nr:CvpA family protein [Desulfohalobiaceae bacterium]
MNILDGVFVIIIILTLFRGLLRGMVKELAFIAGLVLAFLGASKGYPLLNAKLQHIIPIPEIAATVSYIIVFLAIFALVLFLGIAVRHMLQGLMLGWLDRLGGCLLGVFKGALFCGIIILLLMTVFSRDANVLRTSTLAPHVFRISGEMASYIPEHYQERFQDVARELQKAWQDSDLSRWLESEDEGES